MPNILALDTSSNVLSVALQKSEGAILEKKVEGFFTHAENLLPLIDDLLDEASLKIEQVDVVLIGRGPGSFTGLRIGFATLKAMLVLRELDVYGAESLEMIASNVKADESQNLVVALDAHRQRVYAKIFSTQNGAWKSQNETEVLTIEEFLEALPDPCHLTGNALDRYKEVALKSSKKISFAASDQWYPKASTLINWFHNKETSPLVKLTEPTDFVPLYYRRSEAEENQANVRHH